MKKSQNPKKSCHEQSEKVDSLFHPSRSSQLPTFRSRLSQTCPSSQLPIFRSSQLPIFRSSQLPIFRSRLSQTCPSSQLHPSRSSQLPIFRSHQICSRVAKPAVLLKNELQLPNKHFHSRQKIHPLSPTSRRKVNPERVQLKLLKGKNHGFHKFNLASLRLCRPILCWI